MKLLYRLSFVCSVVVATLMPLAIWAVIHLPIGSADVHEWLPEGRSERLRYEAFTQQFGSDHVVVLSWEDARIDDPRMQRLEQEFDRSATFSQYFLSYTSPRRIVEQLRAEPLSLSRGDAIDRLTGVLIGAHGNAAMVLMVSPYGVDHHAETIEWLRATADSVPELGRDALRLVGPVYEAYAVDVAAEASLKQLVLPSTLLGILACWFCVRTLRGMIVVMLLAGIGQLLMIAIVYYAGYQFSAVLIVLPTLVFMLTLAGAVHLMNYRMAPTVPADFTDGTKAIRIGWKPCLLSSGTTVLGMGSLITSQLAPVRQFGAFSAIGLVLATGGLLLLFPVVSDWICFRHATHSRTESRDRWCEKSSRRWLRRYSYWLESHSTTIVGGSIIVLLASCIGLTQLRSSTKFCDMFPPWHSTHEDMVWFEQEIGPIASVEVLMRYRRSESEDILNEIRDLE
ncbi:MAG: hypothetical protein MUF23_15590, partial [Pirellula sp.]|nr:hypothetical protein [Pirellula sp.]